MIKRKIGNIKIRNKRQLQTLVVVKKRRKNSMGRLVGTDSLFKTTLNYKELNEQQKGDYIDKLTDEFLESANDLMLSLKDK